MAATRKREGIRQSSQPSVDPLPFQTVPKLTAFLLLLLLLGGSLLLLGGSGGGTAGSGRGGSGGTTGRGGSFMVERRCPEQNQPEDANKRSAQM